MRQRAGAPRAAWSGLIALTDTLLTVALKSVELAVPEFAL